jgi:hypothetical protein
MNEMTNRIDRLYELLPVVYRQRDVVEGLPLRALLRVIAEQVAVIEDDFAQMYDDWFIETCRDWVVPYIADLVGYQATAAAATIEAADDESRLRMTAIIPRRAVAHYVRDLKRRGTLALLENLASDSGGFSSRAVEFYALMARTQSLDHLNTRGKLADLRAGDSLDLIDTPFDRVAHTADLRNIGAARTPGRHNIPNAGSYIWRLRSYPVTDAPALFLQQRSRGYALYAFSQLGNDSPLFTRAEPEIDSTSIAGEINVPAPIRRRALELHRDSYYGVGKSFAISIDDVPVAAERIVAADLTDWKYRPSDQQVAVDPELGRIVLPREVDTIRVSYHYGFSSDVGAHESSRIIAQPRGASLYRVGAKERHTRLGLALEQWKKDKPRHAVIEIADNEIYTEPLDDITIEAESSLQIRSANRNRPVIRMLDYDITRGERLNIVMHPRARFTLDGVVLAGRPLRIEGATDKVADVHVTIRRSTLVPGWDIHHDCTPHAPGRASIELENATGQVMVDHSIVGPIAVNDETAKSEPVRISVRDSIIDATSTELEAVSGPANGYAWTNLTILRSTIVGSVLAHGMDLGENSIFNGLVRIVRRQRGCVRFCYLTPASRTPQRYHCQPDLAVSHAASVHADEERRRVSPRFTSMRFGSPAYCQLALDCPDEIAAGADDASEMGVFHDLFMPQRAANLRARLDGSTPAGMESGIIYAD